MPQESGPPLRQSASFRIASGGDPDNTIVFGAHLDSVPAGPGINDNGSGAMAILEVAHQFALKMSAPNFPKTRPRIRFCWWGAEEVGMLGSEYYVEHLKKTGELSKVSRLFDSEFLILDGAGCAVPQFRHVR